jgi:hypothetical protein
MDQVAEANFSEERARDAERFNYETQAFTAQRRTDAARMSPDELREAFVGACLEARQNHFLLGQFSAGYEHKAVEDAKKMEFALRDPVQRTFFFAVTNAVNQLYRREGAKFEGMSQERRETRHASIIADYDRRVAISHTVERKLKKAAVLKVSLVFMTAILLLLNFVHRPFGNL